MSSKNQVQHIVMFDFSNLESETKGFLITGFENLAKLDLVKKFEWGTEKNHEDSAMGFSHCFILTFDSLEDRTKYLNSPEHRSYEQEVIKHRNKVLVFDFESKSIK